MFQKIKKILQTGGIKLLIIKVLNRIKRLFEFINFYKESKKYNHDSQTGALIDFVLDKKSWPISTIQVEEEITELMNILKNRKIKNILEIGTADGGTLYLFTRILCKKGTIATVDLPGSKFGGGYAKWKKLLFKSFSIEKQKIRLITGDSHSEKVVDAVGEIFTDGVDFLFIDGDHEYEGVKKDFLKYSPLVKKGGLIVFHDIVKGHVRRVGGVPIFWDEIKKKYQHHEIIKDVNQGGYGLGILYL